MDGARAARNLSWCVRPAQAHSLMIQGKGVAVPLVSLAGAFLHILSNTLLMTLVTRAMAKATKVMGVVTHLAPGFSSILTCRQTFSLTHVMVILFSSNKFLSQFKLFCLYFPDCYNTNGTSTSQGYRSGNSGNGYLSDGDGYLLPHPSNRRITRSGKYGGSRSSSLGAGSGPGNVPFNL